MKHRTDKEYSNLNMKTALQWAKEGKLPNDGNDIGTELWCNPWHQNWAVYYKPDEVHEAGKEELEKFFEPYKEKKRRRKKKREEEEQILWQQELKASYERGVEETAAYFEKQIYSMKNAVKTNVYSIFMNREQKKNVPLKNRKIVFDIETTGLDCNVDEILQISIIDGEGKQLLNSYVKPYYTVDWTDAERIHGITREMVENAPYAHELITRVQEIFTAADTWIAYNGSFDLSFLRYLGIEADENINIIDVMEDFAPLYGEWNSYYESFKWQKLSTCANYFGYEFTAHDSMEDVKATLHCYTCMEKMVQEGTYQKIVDANYEHFLKSETAEEKA